MPEKVLHIDIETRSDIDLSKAGVYPYSESDNFDILLVAAAIDDGEIYCFDLASGDVLPEWFLQALADPDYTKVAHNASFERICFSRFLNGRRSYTFLDPSQWHCTMVHAAMLGLPFSLDGVAKVLGTGEQKDKTGTDLIKYFCVPCKPTESNGGRTWNNPADAPEKWSSFKDYCIQDVATERDIYYRLQRFPIPESERLVYILDQQINDRGVLIDLQMVEQAIKCDLLHSEILTRRAYELTALKHMKEKPIHRAYANPTEDLAIGRVMRQWKNQQKRKRGHEDFLKRKAAWEEAHPGKVYEDRPRYNTQVWKDGDR